MAVADRCAGISVGLAGWVGLVGGLGIVGEAVGDSVEQLGGFVGREAEQFGSREPPGERLGAGGGDLAALVGVDPGGGGRDFAEVNDGDGEAISVGGAWARAG